MFVLISFFFITNLFNSNFFIECFLDKKNDKAGPEINETPEFIIKQFDYFAEQGVKNVKIADELFVLNPNHFMKICDLIIERKYNFNIWAYSRIDTCKPQYLEKLKKAGVNSGRLIINSTVGILGLIDVAERMGFPEYEKEDYGQSLASMGVGPGCYIVLPVLGPSTVRDTAGSIANLMGGDPWYNITVKNDTQYFSDFDYYASRVTSGIDFRAKNFDAIENLEKNSLDFYASVKSLYLQDRRKRIANASGATQTQDDSDWEEIE